MVVKINKGKSWISSSSAYCEEQLCLVQKCYSLFNSFKHCCSAPSPYNTNKCAETAHFLFLMAVVVLLWTHFKNIAKCCGVPGYENGKYIFIYVARYSIRRYRVMFGSYCGSNIDMLIRFYFFIFQCFSTVQIEPNCKWQWSIAYFTCGQPIRTARGGRYLLIVMDSERLENGHVKKWITTPFST